MIKDFEIKNFRGIQSLKLEEFSNVNIFLGKPNTGKTSILEALYLYLSKDPISIPDILKFRRITVDDDCFQSFFYDYKLKNKIILGNKEKLEIHCGNTQYTNVVISGSQQKNSGVDKIIFDYTPPKEIKQMQIKRNFVNPFQIQFHNKVTFPENNQPNLKKADFIYSDTIYGDTFKDNLEKIISNTQKQEMLNGYLKKFSEDIQEIAFLKDRIVVRKKHLDNVISLKIMGAGFQKYIAIVLSILQSREYIFIDEIENGLHFENIDLLLEFILKSSDNIQFFITTHNEELLKHLSILLEDRHEENVSVFNVYTDKDFNIKVGRYSQKNFIFNTENNNEMRD